jgi:hypothetical protein
MGAIILPETKEQYLELIEPRLGKISQRQIARELKIGKTTVNKWAKEELNFIQKKHTVNENFFDILDEESSYLLGLIYADGNIAWNTKKGYYCLTITASAKDVQHLERLRKILSSTKPLLYSSKTNSYRLIVNNKKLCKKLMKLGVIPKKSLIVRFPKNIPKQQLKHFIRGVIDGDGNVRFVERKRSPYFEITISSGSKRFCDGLVRAIKTIAEVNTKIRKAGKNTYILQYSCSRGEKLAKCIYSNATIFLERKYLQYKNKMRCKDYG